METYQVTFLPDQLTVSVRKGTSLLIAARKANIDIKSPCGGNGTCGKCAVKIISGHYDAQDGDLHLSKKLKDSGYSLGCKIIVRNDMTVEVPASSRLSKHKVVLGSKKTKSGKEQDYFSKKAMNPICKKYIVQMDPPDLADCTNDLDRLKKVLKDDYGILDAQITLKCLGQLPDVLRDRQCSLTVTISYAQKTPEIIALEKGVSVKPTYGMAIDIGTTTIVVNLLDMDQGKIVDRAGTYNRQAVYGSDVITRIIYSEENKGGLEHLQKSVMETINDLVTELLKRNKLEPRDISVAVCAGNTIMIHFLMGVPASYLRLEPYVPAAIRFPEVRAKELGISINPEGFIITVPCVSSYVGGDITSGVLANMISNTELLTLFIDIGTNGELVLGNKEWLVTCSCSAGPAFEGSGISCGMRAMDGAIDLIEIDPESLGTKWRTIGNQKPLGICGSGLIHSLSEMMEAGIIDRAGKMFKNTDSEKIKIGEEGLEYVLVSEDQSGTGHDIVVTEGDIKNLLRAKGAIFAGIRTMLQMVELETEAIDRVYIAGGFGSELNITDAIHIGMLPDFPLEKYEYVGNSSIQGAMIMLLCREALMEADEISGKMTYLELSVGNQFMDEFISALFIPHTNMDLFPSLNGNR